MWIGPKFAILLLQFPECWDYRCMAPFLTQIKHKTKRNFDFRFALLQICGAILWSPCA